MDPIVTYDQLRAFVATSPFPLDAARLEVPVTWWRTAKGRKLHCASTPPSAAPVWGCDALPSGAQLTPVTAPLLDAPLPVCTRCFDITELGAAGPYLAAAVGLRATLHSVDVLFAEVCTEPVETLKLLAAAAWHLDSATAADAGRLGGDAAEAIAQRHSTLVHALGTLPDPAGLLWERAVLFDPSITDPEQFLRTRLRADQAGFCDRLLRVKAANGSAEAEVLVPQLAAACGQYGVSADVAAELVAGWLERMAAAAAARRAAPEPNVIWGPAKPAGFAGSERNLVKAMWWVFGGCSPTFRVVPAAVAVALDRAWGSATPTPAAPVVLGAASLHDDEEVLVSAGSLVASGTDPADALDTARLILHPATAS